MSEEKIANTDHIDRLRKLCENAVELARGSRTAQQVARLIQELQDFKNQADYKRICVVGYKIGVMEKNGWIYGKVFDRLGSCCQKFNYWFFHTGNTKTEEFGKANCAPFGDKDGINLVTRGNRMLIELRASNPLRLEEIKSCPFCGAEIVVRQTKRVLLREKYRQEPDGYEEVSINS
jgi:hypothetical protein